MVDTQASFPDRPDPKSLIEYVENKNITQNNSFHFFDAEIYQEHALDEVIDSFVSWNNIASKGIRLIAAC